MIDDKTPSIQSHSQEFLIALGAISVEFADLENTIGLWASVILNPQIKYDIVIEAFVRQLSYRQKVNSFRSIFKQRFPKHTPFTELDKLTKKLSVIGEKRNSTAHTTWSLTDQPDFAFYGQLKLTKSGVTYDQSDYTDPSNYTTNSINYLQELADEIKTLDWEFAKFASEYIGVQALNDTNWSGAVDI